jgi:hypothetical protein
VNDGNGFLLQQATCQCLRQALERIIDSSPQDLRERSRAARQMAQSFRFEVFGQSLLTEMFARLDVPRS